METNQTKPPLSNVIVTGMLPGHRFGEVSLCTGEVKTYTIQMRIWPNKTPTAKRVSEIVYDQHKVELLTSSVTWEVLE